MGACRAYSQDKMLKEHRVTHTRNAEKHTAFRVNCSKGEGNLSSLKRMLSTLLVLCLSLATLSVTTRMLYPMKYSQQIARAAQMHQMDPYFLAAIIHTESAFRSDAVSRRGAVGLMQLMQGTTQWFNARRDVPYSVQDLYDPWYNVETGAAYFVYLLQRFEDPSIALAAWNAGEGTVREWIRRGYISENTWYIPYEETRKFIEKVNHAYQIYQDIYN